MTKATIGILINEPIYRDGLALHLGFEGYQILTDLPFKKPDIVIIDAFYKNAASIIATQSRNKQTRVLVLCRAITGYLIRLLITKGANGFISKDSDFPALAAAIDDLSAKGHFYSRIADTTTFRQAEKFESISIRERKFLRYVGTSLTYAEIGKEMNCSLRAIDYIRDQLLKRFKLNNRPELALFALNSGITVVRSKVRDYV